MAPPSLDYPFTQEDLERAAREWGCNCGPSALAFAVQKPLDTARHAIPGFEQKRYTSPSMMKAALDFLRVEWSPIRVPPDRNGRPDVEPMFDARPALVRIQFTGPWCKAGANPKWAYWHTHWVTAWAERGVPLVFDCNGGVLGVSSWEEEIIPLLATGQRRDGGWYPTHIWRLA